MFDRVSTVIRDGTKLSFEYVPEKLRHREEQMRALEILFRPMISEGRSCSAFLYGGVGTGKTVTAKRFCADMAAYCQSKNKRMDCIFVNCRIRNSEYSVLLQFVRHFDRGFPERGFSQEELLRSFRRRVEESDTPLVIILDEVDILLKNSNRNLIYQLSRMSEELKKSSISLILISQIAVSQLLDEASVSTFKRANAVRFERYSGEELAEIIRYRADEALVPGALADPEVRLLSEIATQFGDARFAVELIERAAMLAENEENGHITADNIRTANAMIYSDVSENKLRDLDMNRKLTLLAIARAIKKKSSLNIVAAEKTYAVVCEEFSHTARKHTQFWMYVQDLERAGFVSTEVRNEQEGGRVTYISITNIPPKELAKKIEYLLEAPLATDEEIW
jgi:cell division control protein 6